MPQIIVIAGGGGAENGIVMLRERVNATDFESDRFTANLLERLGWAVEDATAAERVPPEAQEPTTASERSDAQELTSASEPDLEPGGRDPEPLGVH